MNSDFITRNLSRQKDIYLFDCHDVVKEMQLLYQFLSVEEKEKLNRIRSERGQQYFLFRKGMLRLILGRHMGMRPQDIKFLCAKFGKPYIPYANIQFNISHSKTYLMIGISDEYSIGVDIEAKFYMHKERHRKMEDIFSLEEWKVYHMLSDEEQECFFMRTWVRKEAVCKAVGTGLTVELDRMNLLEKSGQARGTYFVHGRTIELHSIEDEAYYAAVAYVVG